MSNSMATRHIPDSPISAFTDEEVQFTVQDSGIGIAQRDIEKLFDKFTQFNRKAGSKHEGTGLGLAIVEKLVKMHRGGVRVESEVGRGTNFAISSPGLPATKRLHVSPLNG